MSLRLYKKKLEYSYAYGIYPTIELLEKAPDKVQTVLLSKKAQNSEGVDKIRDLCKKNRINFDYADNAINKIAFKENTHAIGVFNKYYKPLQKDTNHVLLVNPTDMGNVGTIIRSMVGFGINNLALIRPAIDIFDPKVVRTSMGSIFDLNFQYYNTYDEYNNEFGSLVKYPFLINGKKTLGQFEFTKPATLILGNEWNGLDEQFSKIPDSVRINLSKKVNSLNLAIAASVALYEFTK